MTNLLTQQEVRERLAANLRSIRNRLGMSQAEMAKLMNATTRQVQRLESAEADMTLYQAHSLTQLSSVTFVNITTGIAVVAGRSGAWQELADECHARINFGGTAELKFILDYWDLLSQHQVIVGTDINDREFFSLKDSDLPEKDNPKN